MKKRLIPKLVILGGALGLGLGLQACSLKPKDNRSVRIALPSSDQLSAMARGLERPSSGARSSTMPTSISQFSCFGLNVTGPGIPNDPRLPCRDPNEGIGRLGGLVPVGSSYIDVTVAGGPSRRVQLWGVVSSIGCPDINSYLDRKHDGSTGGSGGDDIQQPVLLGEAVVDIYNDTEIQIVASMSNARQLFNSCGGGETPPTLAYKGPLPEPSPTSPPLKSPLRESMLPNAAPGDIHLTGSAVTSADMPLFARHDLSESNVGIADVMHSAQDAGYSNGQRAAIQLLWDVTDLNTAATPYAGIDLMMRGGAEGAGCSSQLGSSNMEGVAAGVYYPAGGYFIPMGRHNYYNGVVRWGWGGKNLLPKPINDLSYLIGGRKYVIVNVESNYASSQHFLNCQSVVRVARAGMRTFANQADGNLHSGTWPLGMELNVPFGPGGGGMSNPLLGTSQGASFMAYGGKVPYIFSIVSGAGGTLDSATGYFSASTPGPFTVRVTDAVGATYDRTVEVVSATQAVGYTFSAVPSNATAGNCQSIYVNVAKLDGSTHPSPGTTYTANIGSSGGSFYTAPGDCSSDIGQVSSVSIGPSFGYTQVYFKPKKAGNQNLSASHQSGPSMYYGAYASLEVYAASADRVSLKGPNPINANSCVAYQAYPSDPYGNPIANVATTANPSLGAANTVSLSGSGTFYSDNACMSATASVTIPAGSPDTGVTVYYMNTVTGGYSINTNGSTPLNITGGHVNGMIDVRPSGAATDVRVSGPASVVVNSCNPVTVDLTTLNGSLGSHSGVTVNLNRMGPFDIYTDSTCSTFINSHYFAPGATSQGFYMKAYSPGTGNRLEAYPNSGMWNMQPLYFSITN